MPYTASVILREAPYGCSGLQKRPWVYHLLHSHPLLIPSHTDSGLDHVTCLDQGTLANATYTETCNMLAHLACPFAALRTLLLPREEA